jgi:hypothetical protein
MLSEPLSLTPQTERLTGDQRGEPVVARLKEVNWIGRWPSLEQTQISVLPERPEEKTIL